MRFQVFGSRALPWFWATILFVLATGAAVLQLLRPPGASVSHRSPAPHGSGFVGHALAEKARGGAAQPVPAPARDEIQEVAQHGQRDQQPATAAPEDHVPIADSPPPPERTSGEKAAVLPPAIIEALLSRGEAMVATGNIAGARLLFERAACAGNARGAGETAKMYDSEFLASLHVKGIEPNASLAASWYRRAAALGDSEAEARLRQLTAQASK